MSFLSKFFFKPKREKQNSVTENQPAEAIIKPVSEKSPTQNTGTRAKTIVDWINRELPPLAWNRISIRLFKDFKEQGINLAYISDTTTFSPEQISLIENTIAMLFGKELPENLKNNQ